MNTKPIEKSIDIEATPEQVWNTLTGDSLNRQWYAAFSEGTYAETDWSPGSKAIFKDTTNCGMIGHVAKIDLHKKLVIEMDGQLVHGEEDYTSDIAQQIKGGQESYMLSPLGAGTRLDIKQDMGEEYYERMSATWDKALKLIKDISER